MIPAILAAAGASKTMNSVVSWGFSTFVGDPQAWIDNAVNPEMQLSPTLAINGSLSDFAAERYYFITQIIAPSDKDIRALDDFFESYGYRVDNFGKPNIAFRSTFTYVKTRDAVVYSTNQAAAAQMQAMLNAGCKFWKTEIGK